MQQSRRTAQRLYLVVLPIPSHRSNPANTPAQRVIVPICRRGVSAAHR
jgi:hypothetical protein